MGYGLLKFLRGYNGWLHLSCIGNSIGNCASMGSLLGISLTQASLVLIPPKTPLARKFAPQKSLAHPA